MWRNPDVEAKVENVDVKHNIIHFKKETEKNQEIDYIASIVQNELPQDRYRYFIFPQAKFAEWTEWSDCDVSCGGGTIMRERPCVSYFAKMVGKAAYSCGLEPFQRKDCNKHQVSLRLLYLGIKIYLSVHFGVAGVDGRHVRQAVAQKVSDCVIVDVSWAFLELLDAMKLRNQKVKQLDRSVQQYRRKSAIDSFVHYKHRHQIGQSGRNAQKHVAVECGCVQSENVYLRKNRRKTSQKRPRKTEILEANDRLIYSKLLWHSRLRFQPREQPKDQRHGKLPPQRLQQ